MAEVPFKAEVGSLLGNAAIVALLRDKYYKVDDKTEIALEGNLNFSIGMSGDNLVITMQDVHPKITYHVFKRGGLMGKVKVDGRLTSITITSSSLIIAIDGMPDQTLTLT